MGSTRWWRLWRLLTSAGYISIYPFIQLPALLDPEVTVRSSVHIHRDFALDTHIYRCSSKHVNIFGYA